MRECRLLAIAALLALAGCGGADSSASSPQPARAVVAAASQPAKVDLDAIFPRGRGRDLLLNNCTTCHTFVPIVVLQMTREAWERNSRDHRERVKGLNDADFRALYEYLMANFNPDKPAPALPRELLDTWTSY
ncbi:MAG: hypothetical protein FJW37_15400 [Acidobacteria bacterium]|nr:hypothetical protein [Acidobacteriota bacterium]